jgi:hypothetical protein
LRPPPPTNFSAITSPYPTPIGGSKLEFGSHSDKQLDCECLLLSTAAHSIFLDCESLCSSAILHFLDPRPRPSRHRRYPEKGSPSFSSIPPIPSTGAKALTLRQYHQVGGDSLHQVLLHPPPSRPKVPGLLWRHRQASVTGLHITAQPRP